MRNNAASNTFAVSNGTVQLWFYAESVDTKDHTTLFANGGSSIPPGTFSSYPGQVSALVGPAFDTPQPVITKLPSMMVR